MAPLPLGWRSSTTGAAGVERVAAPPLACGVACPTLRRYACAPRDSCIGVSAAFA